jgi:hypothetical protein
VFWSSSSRRRNPSLCLDRLRMLARWEIRILRIGRGERVRPRMMDVAPLSEARVESNASPSTSSIDDDDEISGFSFRYRKRGGEEWALMVCVSKALREWMTAAKSSGSTSEGALATTVNRYCTVAIVKYSKHTVNTQTTVLQAQLHTQTAVLQSHNAPYATPSGKEYCPICHAR